MSDFSAQGILAYERRSRRPKRSQTFRPHARHQGKTAVVGGGFELEQRLDPQVLVDALPRLVGMCRELYERRQWLWTFLEQEVEATNNASERALWHAVIWRKLSFGTQSAGAAGSWRRC
jgi:hypothetical protein